MQLIGGNMPYSNYPHGFSHGVTMRNIPVDLSINPKANIFWVDSNNGSDSNKGTFTFPFASLDYAISQCTA